MQKQRMQKQRKVITANGNNSECKKQRTVIIENGKENQILISKILIL
jgi:uncharacterized protein YabE (DUF348 family)